jgi:hypothetical protein
LCSELACAEKHEDEKRLLEADFLTDFQNDTIHLVKIIAVGVRTFNDDYITQKAKRSHDETITYSQ